MKKADKIMSAIIFGRVMGELKLKYSVRIPVKHDESEQLIDVKRLAKTYAYPFDDVEVVEDDEEDMSGATEQEFGR